MALKRFWKKHKKHVKPLLELTQRCVDDLVGMRANPTVVDFAKLAFAIKTSVETAYGGKDPYAYFSSRDKWRTVEVSHSLKVAIYNLLRHASELQVSQIASLDSMAAFVVDVEDLRFGWTTYDDNIEEMYVSFEGLETYTNALARLFWKTYPSGHAVLGSSDPKVVYFQDDTKSEKFFETPRADLFALDIKEYLEHNIFRSVLFYGPPGSGKSNLVKSIAARLGLKTLRINNISDLSGQTIADAIRVFNPDAVILEDIDSVNTKDMSDLLDKLETFNNKQKVTFATANAVSQLDNALLRPGRFDEVNEIVHLDREVIIELVNGDEEIYKVARTFPAAFITELMKRVKVKGRDHALANIKDLTDRLDNIDKCNYELKKSDEKDFLDEIDEGLAGKS